MFSSLFRSNNKPVDVVIVGAGVAGIAAYLQISKEFPSVKLVESGKSLEDRLLSSSANDVVNGFGGAGLYSDRKWSGFPAGSTLLLQNPYELRDSFAKIIGYLSMSLPDNYKSQLTELTDNFNQYLGDNTVTSEEIERRQQLNADKKSNYIKLYPSMTINNFDDGVKVLTYLLSLIKSNDILFNTCVQDVSKVGNEYHLGCVSMPSKKSLQLRAKKLVFATGRFGSIDLVKFFPSNSSYSCLELGIRIDIDNYPLLKKNLQSIMSDKIVNDPKIVISKDFFMFNKKISVEFRTFCVCLPKKEGESGYMVNSNDINTNISSFSGSSSYSEYDVRKDVSHIIKGSNMGIMMRIRDPYVISKLSVTHNKLLLKNDNKKVTIDPNADFSTIITALEQLYPSDICHVLYAGINEIVQYITGECINQSVDLYGPCIEGVGEYPSIDRRTYQLTSDPNIFVAGDAVGFARGLVQSMVMGDMCGKYVCNYLRNEYLVSEFDYTKDYQNITLPVASYNKVITSGNTLEKLVAVKKTMHDVMTKSLEHIMNDANLFEQIDLMANAIVPVRFASRDDLGGVLYELHHFFLDKNVYGVTQQLHYITEGSMTEYILLCNAINSNLDMMAVLTKGILNKNLPKELEMCWNSNMDIICAEINKSIHNHPLKSCILALRTRASIKDRSNYNDIPVMQSAIKFKPVPANLYTDDNCKDLQRIERYVVATFTKLLDTIITTVISELDLKLLMCRTKIETQEPSVDPVDCEALYYECHVKVNMKQVDGSSVEYYRKKKLIHDLAGLFEGDTAVLDIFNVMAVSINLLKHPDHGQQFFLTFRTDTKKDMEFIRRHFSKLMGQVVNISNFSDYSIKCITDAECVVYDNNRDLDLPWFPIKTGFLHAMYTENICRLLSAKRNTTLVTSNRDKYKEYQYNQHIIANGLCVYHCNYETECGFTTDLKTDVERKAIAGYEHLGRPIIVEGTGLFIGDTQFPGALTGKVINDMGTDKFCDMFTGKQAIASSLLIEYDGKTMKYYNSHTKGKIADSPRGTNGFGWDNIFVVDDLNKTFSEMTFAEKNKYSMRGKLIESYCE